MKLHEKAWNINCSNIDDSYYLRENVYHGNDRNIVRRNIMDELKYDDYLLVFNKDGEDKLSYKTLNINRCKEYDLYEVDGFIKNLKEIQYDTRKKERDNSFKKLLDDNPDAKCYVKKGGYYYRPNSCGYSEYIKQAGIYDIKEAYKICIGCSLNDNMNLIIINSTEHNNMLLEEIKLLESRLI